MDEPREILNKDSSNVVKKIDSGILVDNILDVKCNLKKTDNYYYSSSSDVKNHLSCTVDIATIPSDAINIKGYVMFNDKWRHLSGKDLDKVAVVVAEELYSKLKDVDTLDNLDEILDDILYMLSGPGGLTI